MSKDTALSSSTVDDISQGISGVSISDNSDICGSCSTNTAERCANCGKEGGNLKACAACKLVKYCSRDCQIAHRKLHKKECRKRAAELRDIELFKHPPLLKEDCQICFLRVPNVKFGGRYKSCCGKTICSGCIHAVRKTDGGVGFCPFCRTPAAITIEESNKRILKRVDAGDAEAIHSLGSYYSEGTQGFAQDYTKAIELWEQSIELGYAPSMTSIGRSYFYGEGVERDEKKAKYYWELGAVKGDSHARHNLGAIETQAGNMGRAVKHLMIAVRDGYNGSLNVIRKLYLDGHATKNEYTKALQDYQKYLAEVKSSQRDEAAAAREVYKYIE